MNEGSSRVLEYITRFKAHTSPLMLGLVGKGASLIQSPPTLPSHHHHRFLPLTFIPLTSPHAATHATPVH
jgi:hypothetical protein